MQLEVELSPQARTDLFDLYLYIADRESDHRALRYSERIEAFCERLSLFPQRGHRRDDLAAGLRVIGFERRVTIAFHVQPDKVVIDRILYAGRNIEAAFPRQPPA